MNGKAIKNLSWSYDNNDALLKKYLYQYGLLLDSKINSFNAKDKKIVNVLDPQDIQDVATKNYVDNLDSAIHDSMTQQINKSYNHIEDKVANVDSSLRCEASLLRAYVDGKINFTSNFYKLQLSNTTASSLDIIDNLYLIQVLICGC
jgi:hypothetical protein